MLVEHLNGNEPVMACFEIVFCLEFQSSRKSIVCENFLSFVARLS